MFRSGLITIALLVGLGFNYAHAGPVSCALAIKGCASGGKDVAGEIKASRAACKGLRDCKKVCKVEHKDSKKAAESAKKDCKATCKGKKGKSKRACKKSCRKNKKTSRKPNESVKKGCLKACRAEYKTPQCKNARKKLAKTLSVKGLGCALKVSSACVAPVP
jgi:hypothetical protein